MAFYQLYFEQKVNASMDEAWDFISSPENLKRITPPHMGFNITSKSMAEKMYPGMIITYKVSPLPMYTTDWMTEITHVKDHHFFVDEQRMGPYKIWHHQHIIEPLDKGVLMKDLITYAPPFGFLGAIANRLIIKKQIHQIFQFRKQAIIEIFGDDPS